MNGLHEVIGEGEMEEEGEGGGERVGTPANVDRDPYPEPQASTDFVLSSLDSHINHKIASGIKSAMSLLVSRLDTLVSDKVHLALSKELPFILQNYQISDKIDQACSAN